MLRILCVILIGLFCWSGTAGAWSNHEFRAEPSPDGSWRVLSMPKEIMESDEFHADSRTASVIYGCRDNGVWDQPIVILAKMYNSETINEFTERYIYFLKTLDKILPDEKIISICFWVDYDEFLLYFHPDKWQDKDFHVEAAKLINKQRTEYAQSTMG